MFSLIPIVLSVPIILLLLAAISMATPYIGVGTLLAVAPWPLIAAGMALILLSVLAAYALSSRRIKRDAIVEAVKDETF